MRFQGDSGFTQDSLKRSVYRKAAVYLCGHLDIAREARRIP
jgi:hypothetical protein